MLLRLPSLAATALVLLTLVVFARTSFAQPTEREPIDVSQRGPQVGDRIPDFSLSDQYGETWTRDSIAGPNGTMLVFLRSADW